MLKKEKAYCVQIQQQFAVQINSGISTIPINPIYKTYATVGMHKLHAFYPDKATRATNKPK